MRTQLEFWFTKNSNSGFEGMEPYPKRRIYRFRVLGQGGPPPQKDTTKSTLLCRCSPLLLWVSLFQVPRLLLVYFYRYCYCGCTRYRHCHSSCCGILLWLSFPPLLARFQWYCCAVCSSFWTPGQASGSSELYHVSKPQALQLKVLIYPCVDDELGLQRTGQGLSTPPIRCRSQCCCASASATAAAAAAAAAANPAATATVADGATTNARSRWRLHCPAPTLANKLSSSTQIPRRTISHLDV